MTIHMHVGDFFSFADNSDETPTECQFIINEIILDKLESKKIQVLDLGCGAGEKIHYISSFISYCCGVDICTDLIDLSIYDEIIIGDVLNSELPIVFQPDLIIASHILPYIRRNAYSTFLQNIQSWLSPKGYAVIFEMTGEGPLGSIKSEILGKKLITSSDKFDLWLEEFHIPHETCHLNAQIMVSSSEQMYEVVKFFCEKIHTEFESKKVRVRNQINHLKKDGHYELNYHIKAYVFKNFSKN